MNDYLLTSLEHDLSVANAEIKTLRAENKALSEKLKDKNEKNKILYNANWALKSLCLTKKTKHCISCDRILELGNFDDAEGESLKSSKGKVASCRKCLEEFK